ncbi:MAG: histidinol-phosphate transaminase [Clostridiaceae bacterium]|nr:histidinol-phosphate transaminase [Clostridiaceae bacterium]
MISDLVRPELKGFVPYKSKNMPYRVKLDANESPFGLPEGIRRRIADYFQNGAELNIYPDSDSVKLRDTLAKYWKVDPEGIVTGTGSNELIKNIINVFVQKGERIVLPSPSFEMYSLNSIMSGGIPVEVVLRCENGFKYDTDEFIDAVIRQKAKMVFLCNPNNPTGNLISNPDIEKIAGSCSNSVIVVDEAYAEFSGQSAVPLVTRYSNIVVLRSFSKAYGLAGVRCGYSISSREMANEINKIKAPFNLNSLTQFIACLVFEEREEAERRIKYLCDQRDYLFSELSGINGVTAYPSEANFILIKLPDAPGITMELAKRGVLVRGFEKNPLLRDYIRVNTGTREQNEIFINELKAILSA